MKKESKRILIVEDEADVALVVAKILEGRDVHVSTTGSIKETKELLDKEAFDVIIMDRMLPDGDSVQIFKKLKESPALKLLPVLILSGKDRFGDQAEGLDLGADDYMTKPFSPQELRIRVEALLRRAEKFAS